MAKYGADIAYIEDQQCNDRNPAGQAQLAHANGSRGPQASRNRYYAAFRPAAMPTTGAWSETRSGQGAPAAGALTLGIAGQVLEFASRLLTFCIQAAGVFLVMLLIAKHWAN